MNYFQHHLGDYAASTAHLSWTEDMAYTRLMRLYYSTEKPIPIERDRVYRLVRAQSKAERAAIDAVLDEFFVRTDDGYRQHRCDEEIAKANETSSENEAKRANERERQRRHRERRKAIFEALRAHDIVPAWDTSLEQLESMLSRAQERISNAPVTRDSTVTETDLRRLTNNQEPITNNQEEKNKPTPPADAGAALWEFGVTVLTEQGIKEGSARKFIGSLLHDYEQKHVEEALRAAVGKAEAKAYICAVLKNQPKRGQQMSFV